MSPLIASLIVVIVGAVLTALLARWSQLNQRLRDKKLEEYRELLDVLLERKDDILLSKSMPLEVLSSEQQADRFQKQLSASKILQNPLFIGRSLQEIGALERWNEIERMATDRDFGVVQCQTKLNELIGLIKQAAQNVARPEDRMPGKKAVIVTLFLILLGWIASVEYRLRQTARQAQGAALSAEASSKEAKTAMELGLATSKFASQLGLIDWKQMNDLTSFQMAELTGRAPLTLQDILRQRKKILAKPPDVQNRIANLTFDAYVRPRLDKSLADDQIDALRRDWVARFLAGKDVDVPR